MKVAFGYFIYSLVILDKIPFVRREYAAPEVLSEAEDAEVAAVMVGASASRDGRRRSSALVGQPGSSSPSPTPGARPSPGASPGPSPGPGAVPVGPGELVDLQFTLPSDRNWKNRNYFKLVEKQRALGATPMASARDV